jgi:iron complex outermembrane recepter protein
MRNLFGATAAVAFAMPAAAQRADSVRADSAPTLAPIVVRALRALTSAESAPWAVSVRERDRTDRARAGLALDEALRTIPGIQVDNRYNWALGERISVRGFGARAQFGVRGVKVLVDGVPATLPDGQTTLNHVDVALVRRVEVVRGAASSLYGNASGGVLLLETTPPPLEPFAANAGAVGGAHGLRRLHGSVGGTATNTGWLVHVSRLSSDGYRTHSRAESQWALIRAAHEAGPWGIGLVVNAVDYDARNPGSLSDSLLGVDRRQAFRNNELQNTGEKGRQLQAGLTVRASRNDVELQLAPHLVHREIDNPIPGRVVVLEREGGGMRALVRSAERATAMLSWAMGAEADRQHDDRQNFANTDGERGDLLLDQRERVSTSSVFGQLNVAATSAVRLSTGIRWDRASFDAADRLVNATNPDDSGERTMTALSPSFGVSLRVASRTHLYGNVSTSFETPTTTELANRPSGAGGFNPELEPQRAASMELGAKGDVGALRYELAAYHARVRDALVPFEVAGSPGRQFFRNAGRVIHRGVELGLRVPFTGTLRADASYSWTDARFGTYVVGSANHEGNRVPGVAPHRAEAALTWGATRGPFGAIELRTASRMTADDAGMAHSPGYAVVDLRGGFVTIARSAGEATLFAGLSNLFDTRYNASVVVNAFGRRYFEPAPERSLYVGGTLQFARRGSPR